MIDVEIEDEAWAQAVADVEHLTVRSAEAALRFAGKAPSPLRGALEWEELSASTRPQTDMSPHPDPSLDGEEEDIAVLLTDDAAVRDLNQRFRGKDRPTNVLSFAAPGSAGPHLGDIALAHGVCAAEAHAQAKPLADHLAHLVVHGVLHLLGYDHETESDASLMEEMEREILRGFGVADPYAPRDDDDEL